MVDTRLPETSRPLLIGVKGNDRDHSKDGQSDLQAIPYHPPTLPTLEQPKTYLVGLEKMVGEHCLLSTAEINIG